jgi:Ca2+-binding RTX toxin-like protein
LELEPAPEPVITFNKITGTSGRDTLRGSSSADDIYGFGGADVIYGAGGSDRLTGGSGKDKFMFNTALDGSIDKITDFNPADDTIYLDNAIFTKLGAGSLSSPRQISSEWLVDGPDARPLDGNDFLIYDRKTGYLSYDLDGSGSAPGVIIAQLPVGLDLNSGDFFVF